MSVIKDSEGVRVDLFDKLLEDRVLFITGEINDRLANFIVPAMLYLANESSRKPIKLYINSPGGSITAGMAIYDTMRTISCPVHTGYVR